jgi:FMN-dependent NADH-azoreductase
MKNILLVHSSPRGSESSSQRVAHSIVKEIKDRHLSTTVTFRDLAQNPLPHVGPAFVSGLSAKPEELTAAQSEALALSDYADRRTGDLRRHCASGSDAQLRDSLGKER